MTDAPTIRTFSPGEWRAYRDLRLRALTDSPDAFGRTLAEESAGQIVSGLAVFHRVMIPELISRLSRKCVASRSGWRGGEYIGPRPTLPLSIRCGLLRAIAGWV